MKASDVYNAIDSFAPFALQADWDNSGFQVGDPQREVSRVAVSLDPTVEVIQQALDSKAELLVCHHPLIFKPLSRLIFGNPVSDALLMAIKGRLSIISAHTNWDVTGICQPLAHILEIRPLDFLEEIPCELLKLAVFVPPENTAELMESLFAAGAGHIGNYSKCSFRAQGIGSFFSGEYTNPHIGTPGTFSETPEERLELILPPSLRHKVAEAILKNHPYEEPAYEFYPIKSYGEFGYGLYGLWDPPREPLSFVAEKLHLDALVHTSFIPKLVKKVALMPGSMGSTLKLAQHADAELLITGDLKHHLAQEAKDLGIGVISAGHFETEDPGTRALMNILKTKLDSLDFFYIDGISPMALWER
ncbi:MAG: Nif3-like dinuclear metal center hexameric protein [Deltaproteobacteria bacterium]|nr:Nif3-like dinuclear metal center hexameric protein [Deltaproteobacteria bacterium]